MASYNTVVAAVDLTDEASMVLSAAREIAVEQNATLTVITAIRPFTHAYGGIETAAMSQAMANFEPEAEASARKTIGDLCSSLDIDPAAIAVAFGKPGDVIKAKAEELGADLIVVGSHGKHGLGLLLGSTANGVLHGAPCDVLTIRIME